MKKNYYCKQVKRNNSTNNCPSICIVSEVVEYWFNVPPNTL